MKANEYKNCHYCDEEIKSVAVKCRYCKSMLNVNKIKRNFSENTMPGKAKKSMQEANLFNNHQSSRRNKRAGLFVAVIAGCLLIVFLAINAIIDQSFGDNDVVAVESGADEINDFELHSLETLGTSTRHSTLGLLNQMNFHKNRGYQIWQQFLQKDNSSASNYFFEVIGEQYIDIINGQVLDSIIGTEGLIKGSVASEAWRIEAIRYYVNSSIELSRMQIYHINILIEHNYTGEESLLVKANQYEQSITAMHTSLNDLFDDLERALK